MARHKHSGEQGKARKKGKDHQGYALLQGNAPEKLQDRGAPVRSFGKLNHSLTWGDILTEEQNRTHPEGAVVPTAAAQKPEDEQLEKEVLPIAGVGEPAAEPAVGQPAAETGAVQAGNKGEEEAQPGQLEVEAGAEAPVVQPEAQLGAEAVGEKLPAAEEASEEEEAFEDEEASEDEETSDDEEAFEAAYQPPAVFYKHNDWERGEKGDEPERIRQKPYLEVVVETPNVGSREAMDANTDPGHTSAVLEFTAKTPSDEYRRARLHVGFHPRAGAGIGGMEEALLHRTDYPGEVQNDSDTLTSASVRRRFPIDKDKVKAALNVMDKYDSGMPYNLIYNNCTTFVANVAKQAAIPGVEGAFQETDWHFGLKAKAKLLSSPLRLRPRVAAFLLGQEAPPTLPDGILHYLNPDGLDELFLHTATRDALLRLIGEVGEKGGQLLVHLIGAPGTGRKLLLRTVSAQTGLPFLSVDVQRLPEDERAGQALLDEITTEAYLTESAVHLEVRGALQPEQAEAFRRLEDALATRVPIVCVTAAPDELPRVLPRAHVVTLELGEADITQREQIWQYYAKPCPLAEDISLTAYASRYYLTPDQIRRSLFSAMTLAAARGQAQVTDAMLSQAVMQNRSVHIDGLAQRLQSTFTWDDIELPDEQRSLLQLAGARMRLRRCVEEDWGFRRKVTYGRGVSVLLHGPPGTGKTMAAQVLANDIGMELYRVDLSQVVDKYIGETEKNLARIFDSAQKSNVILFFDEADALFSKRTEVTSSNDRHANAETAYILQRIETYDGMTILATNLSNNFDPAFMRRITYTVRFEMPDEAMRLRLWQKNLPPAAPRTEGLDLAFFAKTFALSGSAIKQILLNAAYMAAMEEKPISARHLVRAVKYDAIKSGRICEREQFGVYASYY